MRRTLSLLTALTLMAVAPAQNAAAQTTHDHSDSYAGQPSRGQNSGDETPYAGRDLAYDYITRDYYTYTGPDPKDRRADEQDGYRTGVLHTQRAAYRPHWRYGYSACGCATYISGYSGRSYRYSDERYSRY